MKNMQIISLSLVVLITFSVISTLARDKGIQPTVDVPPSAVRPRRPRPPTNQAPAQAPAARRRTATGPATVAGVTAQMANMNLHGQPPAH